MIDDYIVWCVESSEGGRPRKCSKILACVSRLGLSKTYDIDELWGNVFTVDGEKVVACEASYLVPSKDLN
jgi:hypothetical protein